MENAHEKCAWFSELGLTFVPFLLRDNEALLAQSDVGGVDEAVTPVLGYLEVHHIAHKQGELSADVSLAVRDLLGAVHGLVCDGPGQGFRVLSGRLDHL